MTFPFEGLRDESTNIRCDVFQFLHAADLHLDSPLKGLQRYEGAPVDEIRGATRRALVNLVDLAIAQAVNFVLIAGDVYDGDWKDHNTGLFFIAQMVRLREAGIPVVMISGNHDAANRMTRSLRLPDNVEVLSHTKACTAQTKSLLDLGVAIHGRSFAHQAEYENLAVAYPDRIPGLFNIGLLHTSLTGSDGHEPYAPCTLDELSQKQYDYWALGHVHNRNVVSQDSLVVFPGNLQGRHIRETDAKGCYLVRVDDHGTAAAEFQPVDVMRWEICEVAAGHISQLDDLPDLVSQQLLKIGEKHPGLPLAVRLQVNGSQPVYQEFCAHAVNWTNQLRATALESSSGSVWIEKVKCSPPAAEIDLERAGQLEGPVEELRQHLAELKQDESGLLLLAEEISDLAAKLPGELLRGEDALAWKDPQQLRQWLGEVEGLLLNRLTQGPAK